MTFARFRAKAGPDLLLPALLALSVVRLWLMPLRSSFWIDEMGTVFVARHGAADPSLAVAPQVAVSIYYWLPRAAQALFGSSEVVYRLPSVLAMAIAVALVARLAARLIHPRAGWFAAFACLAISGIDYQAADARPYALGTCVAAAGVLFLVRWLDVARWRDGVLFALFAGLLWRVHLVFWPFYLVFAGYAVARLAYRRPEGSGMPDLYGAETRAGWLRTAAVFGLAGLTLLPVLAGALALFRDAKAHVIVKPPSLHELEHSLRWNVVVLCAAGAWILSRFRPGVGRTPKTGAGAREPGAGARKFLLGLGLASWYTAVRVRMPTQASAPARVREPPGPWPLAPGPCISGTSWALFLAWWLCQPVGLFAFSWLTGNSVFVRRYLFLMLPGAALTATAAAARFTPPARMNRLAALLAVAGLLALGNWGQLWPPHEHSDWRGAALKVNELALGPDTPVICPSPFIEARPPVWRPDYRLPGFLYAHLPVYPIGGTAYLFPFETSPEAERYATDLTRDALSTSRRFLIYGGNGATRFWRKWFAARPELAGWRSVRLPYGDVDVVQFDAGPGK